MSNRMAKAEERLEKLCRWYDILDRESRDFRCLSFTKQIDICVEGVIYEERDDIDSIDINIWAKNIIRRIQDGALASDSTCKKDDM